MGDKPMAFDDLENLKTSFPIQPLLAIAADFFMSLLFLLSFVQKY